LLTSRNLSHTSNNAKILVLYADSNQIDKIERNLNFSELLVVSWNCFTDLHSWINKRQTEQYTNFIPNDPKSLPGWTSGINEELPNTFKFKEKI
jgi:hypothetical protein